MKLWIFLFTDPTHRLQSARVAAPDKAWARALLGAELQDDVEARSVLCHWAGEVDTAIGVVEKVGRNQGSGIGDQGSRRLIPDSAARSSTPERPLIPGAK